MAQSVLAQAAGSRRVTIIADGETKVMKRNPAAENGAAWKPNTPIASGTRIALPDGSVAVPAAPTPPDIQDQFAADLESGATGEAAMGESPSPTPGPSDPVAVPAAPKAPPRRKPVIYQDAAAPPAPELAVAEMERLLEEAAQAERDQVATAEQQRAQSQQAVQSGDQSVPTEVEQEAVAAPRKRTRERSLATTGRPCGRCGGGGQIQGEAGFVGACPVCHGEGQVKTWDRALKVR